MDNTNQSDPPKKPILRDISGDTTQFMLTPPVEISQSLRDEVTRLKRGNEKQKQSANRYTAAVSGLQKEYDDFLQSKEAQINRSVITEEYLDGNAERHIRRIARFSAMMGEKMGLPSDEVKRLEYAAPLHDIGKCEVSREILVKPGCLTPVEYTEVKLHTIFGGHMLCDAGSTFMTRAREIALSHHECWDGSGYPVKLKGRQIPFSGRIVHLVDVFDTLTTNRPHKKAYPIDVAFEMINRDRGRQFDPDMVDAMQDSLAALIRVKAEIDSVDNMPDSDFSYSERDQNHQFRK